MSALVWNGESTSKTVYDGIHSFYSSYDVQDHIAVLESSVRAQSWMLTVANANCVSIALAYIHTVPDSIRYQVCIGDALLWWRACGIWRSRVVYCIGFSLMILTFGM